MLGTVVNVAGIVAGGLVGLITKKPLSRGHQAKVLLGALTVFYGLRLTWLSLHGSLGEIIKQLMIAVLSLMLGRLTGRLTQLQEVSNQFGQIARERIAGTAAGAGSDPGAGFKVCAALFCAAPLGIIGSVVDGLSGYFYPLCIKAAIEALATMGFVSMFGWGVMLAAIPVLALQGSITLLCAEFVRPWLAAYSLTDSVNAVAGLLVFSVALVILDLKKLELANYLPSLLFAPLITWIWK
jgi:uncharacterized protein